MSKQDVLADESKFQRACSAFVHREVIYCVSSLMYELREVAERLDDYDTYMTLVGGKPDYEEASREHVFGLDREELVEYLEGRSIQCYDHESDDVLREAMLEDIESEDGFEDFCNENRLEPEYGEIYEHWIVSSYLARLLKQHGHIVEDYMGLTIWGRPTTGQAISIDGVIREIVRELDEHHWIFNEE